MLPRFRQLAVVFARQLAGVVAFEPDEADLRFGCQLEQRVEHAHSGAQDRHEHEFVAQSPARGFGQRSLDPELLEFELPQRLAGDEAGDLLHAAAEPRTRCAAVAQNREFCFDARVFDDMKHGPFS